MYAEERHYKIIQYLQKQKKASVDELASLFAVTGATIRSDLRVLEKEGYLVRSHGGAIIKNYMNFELISDKRKTIHLEAKNIIGQKAASLVEDRQTIIIDTGSTTLQLARNLKTKKDITVITSDLDIAKSLESHNSAQIIILGGVVKKGYHCVNFLQEADFLKSLKVDYAFMGCNSFSEEEGASVADIHLAKVKKLMVFAAQKTALLCDHSKINTRSMAQFALTSQIDYFITEQPVCFSEKLDKGAMKLIY